MAESASAARSQEIENKVDTTVVHAKDHGHRSSTSTNGDGVPEIVGGSEDGMSRSTKKEWFAYVKTKQFWLVLVFGYVLFKAKSVIFAVPAVLISVQASPRTLHYRHEHLLPAPRD